MLVQKNADHPRHSCTFACGNGGHRLDVLELADVFEVWIYHKNHSVKLCVAEIHKCENPGIDFGEIIEVARWHLEYFVDRYDKWVLSAVNKVAKAIKTKKEIKMMDMKALCVPWHVNTLICDDGDYMVDIIEEDDELTCWIYRKNYPLKLWMFGVSKTTMLQNDVSFDSFVALINKTLVSNGVKYKKQLSGVATN